MFEFIEEDLKSNKREFISPRQKEWLKMTARGIRSFWGKSAFISIGFTFPALTVLLVNDSRGLRIASLHADGWRVIMDVSSRLIKCALIR